MAATSKDPHSIGEIARVIGLGIRRERRIARGKSTAAIDRRVDEIREKAQAREDKRRKK